MVSPDVKITSVMVAILRNSFLGHGHLETMLDKVVAISGKVATNRSKSQLIAQNRNTCFAGELQPA